MATDYRQFAILYVDDEAANLTAFRFCFEDQFRILTAQSGTEALEILDAVQVAAILTDQRMPGMSGAELCAKARDAHPDVVRMVVTAYADITAAVASINAGQVSRYILKPWREEELAGVIRAAIDAHQLASVVNGLQARILQHEQQATSHTLMGLVLHELSGPAAALHAAVEWIGEISSKLGPALASAPAPDVVQLGSDLTGAAADAAKCSRLLTSRIEGFRRGDTSTPQPEPSTDLAQAVQSAVAIMRGEVRRRAQIEVDLDPVPPVAVSATLVGQVLMNLLLNANDAITPGHPGDHRISVRTRKNGTTAILEVSDTGAGIADEALARIFEPRFSTKPGDAASHGFGLAIVKDIVTSAGGEVTVRTEKGKGSSFVVKLPLARA